MKRWRRLVVVSVVAAGLITGSGLASFGAPGVLAASNGQQLALHDIYGSIYSAKITGDNQFCFDVALEFSWPDYYLLTTNAWWQWSPMAQGGVCANGAVVTVQAFKTPSYSDPLATYTLCVSGTCYPPHYQSGSAWTSCQMDRPGGGIACAAGYKTE